MTKTKVRKYWRSRINTRQAVVSLPCVCPAATKPFPKQDAGPTSLPNTSPFASHSCYLRRAGVSGLYLLLLEAPSQEAQRAVGASRGGGKVRQPKGMCSPSRRWERPLGGQAGREMPGKHRDLLTNASSLSLFSSLTWDPTLYLHLKPPHEKGAPLKSEVVRGSLI